MPILFAMEPPANKDFHYEEAFARNIGWITEWEQQALRGKTVAIAGLGGVGGIHLLTLARLGIGSFHVADLDTFDLVNLNRQAGAAMSTLGRPKVDVLAGMARDINPELDLTLFKEGVSEANIDAFLDGVDLFVDGLDFFALDIRGKVFARCAERGIPAITAAPLGMGTAYLVFMPGGMTFEEYFRLDGLPVERRYVNFALGLSPKGFHRAYLVDPSRLDLAGKKGPSSASACQLCAGVTATEAVKILVGRGRIRAAPWYHHFDAFRAKWTVGRLRGGNRNPVQALKLRLAYRLSERLSRDTFPAAAPAGGSEVEQILDMARWAPSGDNNQPWRFEISGRHRVRVRVRDQAGEDVYDYNDGQPTLLAAGFLLESLRIAASAHGRGMDWRYAGRSGHEHLIDVDLGKVRGTAEDPLLGYLTVRSVDRGRYRTTPLSADQKRALEACLDDDLSLHWFEGRGERWRMARVNAAATDIRLRIPEAFRVHRRILDWARRLSPVGVPGAAIGLDPLAQRMTRWVMADWTRMNVMNRFLGGTVLARLEMDLFPGLSCAAHFSVARRIRPEAGDEVPALLRTGMALQRLWLTATRMGLVMQPGLAPLCFAHYGRHGIDFTKDAAIGRKARALAARVDGLYPDGPDDLLFMGRMGQPLSRAAKPRSVRRPLKELMFGEDGSDAASAA